MRNRLAIAVLIVALAPAEATAESRPRVALQPLGAIDAALVARAKAVIAASFAVDVDVLPGAPLPPAAYFKPRGRHRAEKLLDWLDASVDANYATVVGLTAGDISTTRDDVPDWGIFGLGALGGRACVISTFRLKKNASQQKIVERLEKVVVHEVGHTLGLPHCATKACIMQDAEGTIKTVDGETLEFCAECKALLRGKKPEKKPERKEDP